MDNFVYCIFSDCPVKTCERHQRNLSGGRKTIRVADYSKDCVGYIKHGIWIDVGHNGTYQCSECGQRASRMKYCGHCGAIMDKGE